MPSCYMIIYFVSHQNLLLVFTYFHKTNEKFVSPIRIQIQLLMKNNQAYYERIRIKYLKITWFF